MNKLCGEMIVNYKVGLIKQRSIYKIMIIKLRVRLIKKKITCQNMLQRILN